MFREDVSFAPMNNKDTDRADQMNLSVLKYLVISVLTGFFRFLSFCGAVIRKRTIYLLSGLFLGLFLAMFYYYVAQTKYYQASMIVASTRLPKKSYAGIISQLNNLARSGSTDKLAAEMRVPATVAANIVYIDTRNMLDEPLEADTSSKLNESFQVLFGIRQNALADSIQSALISYLNNLPYLKKLTEVEQGTNRIKLDFLESELNRLDSLEGLYNRFLATSRVSSTFYNDAIDPAKIYDQSGRLLTALGEVRREIYVDSSAVSLVDHIKTANTTRSKSLSMLMIILGFGGLAAGFLLGLMIETRKRLLP
ncbi:MAG TPA: hypothetical protein VMH27_02615 [Puia sp.]|nr:hypothetical protein [Puia sp.]